MKPHMKPHRRPLRAALIAALGFGLATLGLATPASAAAPAAATEANNAFVALNASPARFSSTPSHAFVDNATGKPFIVNGVNIKKGEWIGGDALGEIAALGATGAPDFNTVRIVMEWSAFQQSPTTFNEAAFAQLDTLIEAAKSKGLYVILDPIHAVTTTSCSGTTTGSSYHVPQWAWAKQGVTTNADCTIRPEVGGVRPELDVMDDVLADSSTAAYLQHVLARYNPATTTGAAQDRARQVIAVDLVNEPHASDEAGKARGIKAGSAPARMQQLVETVYGPWLAPTGTNSLRAVNTDTILIVEPIVGSGSLVGVDLSAVAKPNVVMSLHDYFGLSTNTDPTMGMGYSQYGYVAIERTDNWKSGEPAYVGNHDGRKTQHTQYVQQFQNWAKNAGLPLYVGEYGIVNAETKGKQSDIDQYAKDTVSIYEGLGLSRTVWTHGNDGGMQIWNGSYSPQAFIYARRAAVPTRTVTYSLGGHGVAIANVKVNDGDTVSAPAVPTEKGWVFGGWYSDAKLSKQFDFTAPITGDVTLYAKWTAAVPPPVDPCDTPRKKSVFTDIAFGGKFYTEIDWMHCKQLTKGNKQADGTLRYAPKDSLTREAMAAFMYRLEAPKGYVAPKVSPFSDVSTGDKFYAEIAWMYDRKLSTGTKQAAGKPVFDAKAFLTREAMAAFIYRYENPKGYVAPKTSTLVDMKPGMKFYKEISWMYDEKLTTGTKTVNGPEYRPKLSLSREAMAAFIYRLEHN